VFTARKKEQQQQQLAQAERAQAREAEVFVWQVSGLESST